MTTTRTRVLPVALFAAFTLAALVPVRNYDLFWHLATGRWIVEHRALPFADPFAIASERTGWVNGEWLFQVVAYAIERAGGLAALSVARSLLAASVFTLGFLAARRKSEEHVALLLAAIAFAGAAPTFDFRPASAAALFAAAALVIHSPAGWAVLSALWMNVHPSALLAPAIAAAREWLPGGDGRRTATRLTVPLVSALALLVTPHGLTGILAPLRLLSYVRSGEFVNAEWLPSPPSVYPLLYVCLALAAVAFATAEERRSQLWRVVVFVLLGWLAVRHVRNQPLFFAAFPLLVAPSVRPAKIARMLAYTAAAAALAIVAVMGDHRLGVAPERFPIEAVARLQGTGLRGNVYNPDQFGGFLIWSFYPERRVLTDGRNELYRGYIPEYARARADERAWRALLAKYRIDVAVDEYREPLPVVHAATGRTERMPASLAYWPRKEWALIGYDRAAMVFARRKAFPAGEIAKWEIRGAVPDAPQQ